MELAGKIRIEDVLYRVESYLPEYDEDLLRHAYVLAAKRHLGQVRRSGESYLVHPLTVAWILAEMELDETAIAVGMLHDILEDTDTSAAELEEEFGPEVTRLVAARTKISTFESSFSSTPSRARSASPLVRSARTPNASERPSRKRGERIG